MKIKATINFKFGQVSQAWPLIPRDEERNEDPVLIFKSFDNGDLIGIPLNQSLIKKLDSQSAEFGYADSIDFSKAELIPRVGKPN